MALPETFIGKTFGRLKIIGISSGSGRGTMCTCVCACTPDKETICIKPLYEVVNGNTKSCGKCGYKQSVISKDITGKRFGILTALHPTSSRNSAEQIMWRCKCDCGRELDVSGSSLRTGHTKSCGKCGYTEQARFNLVAKWKTDVEYHLASRIFDGMIQRCYNPKNNGYKNYGGRGIYICDEWLKDRSKFVEWSIQNGYRPDLSIDRIDNDGPYAPWNCRWVSNDVQQNNRRSCHFISVNNELASASTWARRIGVSPSDLLRMTYTKGDQYTSEYIRVRLNLLKEAS